MPRNMETVRVCSASGFADNPFCSTLNTVIFLTMLVFVSLLGGILVYLLYYNHRAQAQRIQETQSQPSSQSLYPPAYQPHQLVPTEPPISGKSSSPTWQWILGSRQYRPLTSGTPLFPHRSEMQSPIALSSSHDAKKVPPEFSTRLQRRGRSRTPRTPAVTSDYGTMDDIRTTEITLRSSTQPIILQSPSQGTIGLRRSLLTEASPTGVFMMDEDLAS